MDEDSWAVSLCQYDHIHLNFDTGGLKIDIPLSPEEANEIAKTIQEALSKRSEHGFVERTNVTH